MRNTIENHKVANGFEIVSRNRFYNVVGKVNHSDAFKSPNDSFETFNFFDAKDNLVGFCLVGRNLRGVFEKVYYTRKELINA